MQEETIGSSEKNELKNISNKWRRNLLAALKKNEFKNISNKWRRNLLAALKKMNLKIFQINGGDYWQL